MEENEKENEIYFECGEYIWRNLQTYWRDNLNRESSYEPFADLFARLGESAWLERSEDSEQEVLDAYELSAYFHQVSYGEVPQKIFNRGFGNHLDAVFCGLKINREPTWSEKLLFFMSGKPGWLARIALLMSFLFFLGNANPIMVIIAYALMSWLLEWLLNPEARNGTRIIIAVILAAASGFLVSLLGNALGLTGKRTSSLFPISSSILTTPATRDPKVEPLGRFETTSQVLQQIVAYLAEKELLTANEGERKFSEKIIIMGLRDLLGSEFDLQYGGAIKREFAGVPERLKAAKKKWVEAISLYQKRKIGQPLGYIEPGSKTAESLKRDIKTTELFQFGKKTKPAIGQMIAELQNDIDLRNAKVPVNYVNIVTAIKSTLRVSYLDYTSAVEGGDRTEIKRMIEAIRTYQSRKGIDANGIIDINDKTYKTLQADAIANLISN